MADELTTHAQRLAGVPVRHLFATDPTRFQRFSRELEGLLFDFSRQRIDADAMAALAAAADRAGLRARIDAMFDGAIVSVSALFIVTRMPLPVGTPPEIAML